MRNLFALLSILVAVPLGACAAGSTSFNGNATIVPRAITASEVPPLQRGAPIAVVAGPAADEWFVLSERDPEKTAANLRVWTDEAAAAVRRDLQTLGATIDAAATKKVEVTITRVVGEVGFARSRVTVTLQVTTGDGGTTMFTKDTTSMRGAVFCSEDAMRSAIVDALQDGRVRAYLES